MRKILTELGALGKRFPSLHDRELKDVLRGAVSAFSVRAVGMGMGFVFGVLLARYLGPAGSGIYYLALSMMTIATVFGRVGLDNALLRFVAGGLEKNDLESVAGVARLGINISLAAAFLAAVALYFLAPWLSHSVFDQPGLRQPIQLMAFAVIPYSLLCLYSQMLRAAKKIMLASLVQGALIPSLNVIAILIIAASIGLSVSKAVLIYTLSSCMVLGFAFFWWRISLPSIAKLKGAFEARVLIAASFPLLLVASTNLVMTWADSLMIGRMMESRDVGLYNAAARTAALTGFVLTAFNALSAPRYAALHATGNITALAHLARRTTSLMVTAALPLLLFFVVFPDVVMQLYGADFLAASGVLAIIAAGQFVNVATGSVGYILMMSGHEKIMRNILLLAALLNIALNAILIPIMGMEGAAIATAVSLAAMNLLSMYMVKRKLGFLTLPFSSGEGGR